MMDALYLILHIEHRGLGLFTTTYDGRLVFNSTDRGRFGLIYNSYDGRLVFNSTYRERFELIYNYL